MHKFPVIVLAAVALSMGACASSDTSGSSKAQANEKGWWRLSKYSRKADFKTWVFGDVRPGKGLLGGDEDGYTLYQVKSSGSSDSSKPTKVRR